MLGRRIPASVSQRKIGLSHVTCHSPKYQTFTIANCNQFRGNVMPVPKPKTHCLPIIYGINFLSTKFSIFRKIIFGLCPTAVRRYRVYRSGATAWDINLHSRLSAWLGSMRSARKAGSSDAAAMTRTMAMDVVNNPERFRYRSTSKM